MNLAEKKSFLIWHFTKWSLPLWSKEILKVPFSICSYWRKSLYKVFNNEKLRENCWDSPTEIKTDKFLFYYLSRDSKTMREESQKQKNRCYTIHFHGVQSCAESTSRWTGEVTISTRSRGSFQGCLKRPASWTSSFINAWYAKIPQGECWDLCTWNNSSK